jgi:hypothetical protein
VANKNIIILNGKHYDAVSGTIVMSNKQAAPQGQSVDGFRPTATSHKSSNKPIGALKPVIQSKRSKHQIHVTVHSIAQKPQPARTLMRHAVKKPSGLRKLEKPAIKGQTSTDIGQSIKIHTSQVSLHKASSHTVDDARLERSKHVIKPMAIRRFTPVAASTYVPSTRASVAIPQSNSYSSAPVSAPAQTPQPQQNIFEKAMAASTSHQEKYTGPVSAKLRKRQHAGFAALLVAVLMIAGFVAYLNVPNLTMTVASARAGFHASLPAYLPSGFSTKHVGYNTGTVSTEYKSNTDSRSFTITQKESDWDSNALVTNYVTMTNQSYQTYQLGGRSVYIYGEGNATWVDGGVWYTVNSNGSLPNKQLLNIAAGL